MAELKPAGRDKHAVQFLSENVGLTAHTMARMNRSGAPPQEPVRAVTH